MNNWQEEQRLDVEPSQEELEEIDRQNSQDIRRAGIIGLVILLVGLIIGILIKIF